jgi:hypothetical protein
MPGFLGKWGGEREREKTFQKSSSPLSLRLCIRKEEEAG